MNKSNSPKLKLCSFQIQLTLSPPGEQNKFHTLVNRTYIPEHNSRNKVHI